MDDQQQRRLAAFVANRETMRSDPMVGVRCSRLDHYVTVNGGFVVEVRWSMWGLPALNAPHRITLSRDDVEGLRSVWAGAADKAAPSRGL